MEYEFFFDYVRLERVCSDSWITYRLPYGMTGEQIDEYIERAMPGWEYVCASIGNPDEE